MKVLVTGAAGFVGRHLLAELTRHGHQAVTTDLAGEVDHTSDLTDPAAVAELVRTTAPDALVHLAGLSHVPTCKDHPDRAHAANVGTVMELLRAFRAHEPAAKLLFVTSAEVYGDVRIDGAITEDTPLQPSSIYGRTKAEADGSARAFGAVTGLHVMTARPQNHIGPGQNRKFVTPSFAQQIAEQARLGDAAPIMKRGNLESRKNFTDVRDVARAYRLLLERGQAGRAYNIASERLVRIGDILEGFAKLAGIEPRHELHEPWFRPDETAPVLSLQRIKEDTDWRPEIPFEQTLADIYQELV